LFLLVVLACSGSTLVSAQGALTFHDYNAVNIYGDTVSLSQYYGKKVMVVNTASFCAYTPQFEQLEALYQQYHQYNFEILGFPCNDFGSQDPHDDSTILDFCTGNYDVTFPMMHKVSIVTGDTAPVYKWLQRGDLNGVQDAHVAWNFNKFLIDESGHWVAHYLSPTNPLDTAITNWIMSPSVITDAPIPADQNRAVVFLSGNGSETPSLQILNNSNAPLLSKLTVLSVDGRSAGTSLTVNTQALSATAYKLDGLRTGLYFVIVENNDMRNVLKCSVNR